MKYGAIQNLTHFDRSHPMFSEERIYRDLARRIVSEVPMEALQKLFTFEKETAKESWQSSRYRAEIFIE